MERRRITRWIHQDFRRHLAFVRLRGVAVGELKALGQLWFIGQIGRWIHMSAVAGDRAPGNSHLWSLCRAVDRLFIQSLWLLTLRFNCTIFRWRCFPFFQSVLIKRQIPDHPIAHAQIFTEHGCFHGRALVRLGRWNYYVGHLSPLEEFVPGSIVSDVRVTDCILLLIVVDLGPGPSLEPSLVLHLQMRIDEHTFRDRANSQIRLVWEHVLFDVSHHLILVLLYHFFMVAEHRFEEGCTLKAVNLGRSFGVRR